MSGGSHDYIYSALLNQCQDKMRDEELNEMIVDFATVLHDLEWWCSGDIGEDDYRKSATDFKKKWFRDWEAEK